MSLLWLVVPLVVLVAAGYVAVHWALGGSVKGLWGDQAMPRKLDGPEWKIGREG